MPCGAPAGDALDGGDERVHGSGVVQTSQSLCTQVGRPFWLLAAGGGGGGGGGVLADGGVHTVVVVVIRGVHAHGALSSAVGRRVLSQRHTQKQGRPHVTEFTRVIAPPLDIKTGLTLRLQTNAIVKRRTDGTVVTKRMRDEI